VGITAPEHRAPRVGVLIQDPHSLVRQCLRVVVEELDGAEVVAEATQPGEVVELVRRIHPDIVMIDMSRRDLALPAIRTVTTESPTSRVICLAEETDQDAIDSAIRAGATGLAFKSESVDDLIRAFDLVRNGLPTIAPNAAGPILRQYMQVLRDKQDRDAAIIETLASAVDAKDRYTGGHTQRVTKIGLKIAETVDPSLISNEQLRYGFMLHDVGKIGVPEKILTKESPLDAAEWEVMKSHPIIGLQIIAPAGLGEDVEDIVRHHHERWDGAGYPDNLSGGDIPLGARIFSVADAFDAMTTDRPYRSALPGEEAVKEIRDNAGRQFDPSAVEAFLEVVA
jgi:HD-GYP domain-containing protein (c-di-GMP phosphodiesterase class II)